MSCGHRAVLMPRPQSFPGRLPTAFSGVQSFLLCMKPSEPGAVPSSLPLCPYHLYLEHGTRTCQPHSEALVSCKQPRPCLPQPGGALNRGTAGNRASYQPNPDCPANAQREELLFLASGVSSKARVDFGPMLPSKAHVLCAFWS